jgi:acetolactate synthase-1/2/3 large subunit
LPPHRQRSDVAVVVIVLNNGVLGFQKDAETVKFGSYTSACRFSAVDHAAIARGCGCIGTTVTSPDNLGQVPDEALAAQRPWLIEIIADPSAHPPISLFDGTLDAVGIGT